MSVRLSCPFCNTAFELPAVPPTRRTVCLRCGESVPIFGEVETTDGQPLPTPTPFPLARSASRLPLVSIALTAIIVTAFAVWWFTRPKATNAVTTDSTKPALAPATKPPTMLPALKYLPRDSQIVLAVQPQQVVQYAERTVQNPKKLFEELGLPKAVFDGLTDAGLPPDSIDHLAIGASASELRFVVAVVLRQPFDDDRLRDKLKAKVNADRRERWRVDLGGFPLDMAVVNDRTLLFVMRETDLDAAKKPSAGVPDFRAGLRESIARLSPSSFVWAATDSTDWSKVSGLKIAADWVKQPDLPKRLDGVRAVAAGLSFEPEMKLSVRVRWADERGAKELATAMAERFKDAKAEVTAAGEWAEAVVPFDPPKDALGVLKKALEK